LNYYYLGDLKLKNEKGLISLSGKDQKIVTMKEEIQELKNQIERYNKDKDIRQRDSVTYDR
jgi:hypothetical protein